MIKKLLALTIIVFIVVMVSDFFNNTVNTSPTGAPAGKTGSPGDGSNCTSCHGGTASTVTGWITSTIPAEGYTPGQTYTITATPVGSGTKGFQISPQNTSGNLLGTLIAGANTQIVGSGKYITHTNKTQSSWTFNWIAPAAGTGSVTFYGAFAIAYSNIRLCQMTVNENSTGINEVEKELQLSIYPLPAKEELNIQINPILTDLLNIKLYDLNGKLIKEIYNSKINIEQQTIKINKNILSLKSQVYILKITFNNRTINKQIIFQ